MEFKKFNYEWEACILSPGMLISSKHYQFISHKNKHKILLPKYK